jgi:hypothetical protein
MPSICFLFQVQTPRAQRDRVFLLRKGPKVLAIYDRETPGKRPAQRRREYGRYPLAWGQRVDLAGPHLNTTMKRIGQLRDQLETDIGKSIENIRINESKARRLSNTATISFQFVENETVPLLLSQPGVCAPSGSTRPSHVTSRKGFPALWPVEPCGSV